MPHLYIHVPFCKQACHYCDFHFSTTQSYRSEIIRAIADEIVKRRNELPSAPLETIYFGGGTPSMLTDAELGLIMNVIGKHFDVRNDAEITLEANPDDLTPHKIKELIALQINRLSIGIQSFNDHDLRLMNRAHNASEAERSIKASQDAGITNLTADLIYGLPEQSSHAWQENIRKLIALQVPHLSSYCLTVEPKTALAKFVASGKIRPANEQSASEHFQILVDETAQHGFIHYEISNFAKDGFISRHNSSYWKGEPYLGVGPSAHSFDGMKRRWNVANNALYLKKSFAGENTFDEEILTVANRYNEAVMLGLRAMWGVNTENIEKLFGRDYATHFKNEIAPWVDNGNVKVDGNIYKLTSDGKLLADRIAGDAFYVEK